jgi:hypothetical protein
MKDFSIILFIIVDQYWVLLVFDKKKKNNVITIWIAGTICKSSLSKYITIRRPKRRTRRTSGRHWRKSFLVWKFGKCYGHRISSNHILVWLSPELFLVLVLKFSFMHRYNEVANYNYDNPGSSNGTVGHFTQLVWKSTTSIGCARCGGKGSIWYETYIVTDYYPQGNIVSNNYQYYKTNVLRP